LSTSNSAQSGFVGFVVSEKIYLQMQVVSDNLMGFSNLMNLETKLLCHM